MNPHKCCLLSHKQPASSAARPSVAGTARTERSRVLPASLVRKWVRVRGLVLANGLCARVTRVTSRTRKWPPGAPLSPVCRPWETGVPKQDRIPPGRHPESQARPDPPQAVLLLPDLSLHSYLLHLPQQGSSPTSTLGSPRHLALGGTPAPWSEEGKGMHLSSGKPPRSGQGVSKSRCSKWGQRGWSR